ncbi:MAG: TldD/PmbA family protein [Polyangiaceae bacterium]|nr:TldD/PmbA family protein [Polyangiaceae bacterium]
MANETMLDIAKSAVALAKQKGAAEVAVAVTETRNVDVNWRDGKLEKVAEATSRRLGARLYVDGRYSACTTSDLRPDGLASFFDNAVALTRTLAKDPHRSLPDPSLYGKVAATELQLSDPKIGELTAIDMRRAAQKMEEAARSVPEKAAILSVTSGVSHTATTLTRVQSNGFEGAYSGSVFSMWADVSIQDADGRRPEEGDWAETRFYGDLPDLAMLGRQATNRSLVRRGAKKIGSGVMPVVIENRAGSRFVNYLLAALTGSALQQKRSFLDGLVGKPFGSDKLDIADDPLIARGMGSRPFDIEGMGAKRLPLFEQGVLKNYYIDTYYGKKLGMAPTTMDTSNLSWKLGSKGLDALVSDVKEGVLITSFIGGNSNSTTGDFSVGFHGFAIRGGKIAEPIAEMNLSGKHVDVWKRLVAVGNDPFVHSAYRTPTLVFDGMQVAGT